MISSSISWMLAALGIAAAIGACVQSLLGFDKAKVKRPNLSLGLIMAALVIQIAVLGINVWVNSQAAFEAQKKAEREVAFALWAFAEKRPNALEILTKDYPYLYGYFYFKKNTPRDYGIARNYLRNSLARKLYVAPANYVLAVMTRLELGNAGLKEARTLVDAGIAHDPQYSPLYVERALEASFARDYKRASTDFRIAVDEALVHCLTLNETLQPQLSADAWARLNALPEFKRLVNDCAATFAPTPVQDPVTSPNRGAP